MIAALFVEKNGCYYGMENVDPWDISRDARRYDGPYHVIAHPPCERWGRYWGGGPRLHGTSRQKKLGDDGGCFASALASVRKYGGVIEHPEGSHAWRAHGLNRPPMTGGWVNADMMGGWTCCIEQGAYGHRARKKTWLYAYGVGLPSMKWGRAKGCFDLIGEGYHSKEERARKIKTGICQRLSKKQRLATPIPFRDLLISIVSGCCCAGT